MVLDLSFPAFLNLMPRSGYDYCTSLGIPQSYLTTLFLNLMTRFGENSKITGIKYELVVRTYYKSAHVMGSIKVPVNALD